MEIRTLTPSKKREIVIPDEMIGVPRYGTLVHVERPTEHKVVEASIKPTYDPVPESQRLDLPTMARPKGLRRYDRVIDAWVAEPKSIDFSYRRPAPAIEVRTSEGPAYWVVCRATGLKMRRFCAQTPAAAAQIAAEYAINNGLLGSDAYALLDED